MEEPSNEIHVSIQHLRWHRSNVSVAQAAGGPSIFAPFVARVLYRHLEQELAALGEPGILALDFSEVGVVDSSSLLSSICRLLFWNMQSGYAKTVILMNTTHTQRCVISQACAVWPWVRGSNRRRILTIASGRETDTWEILGELNGTEMLLWNIAKEDEIRLDELMSRSNQQRDSVLSNLRVLLDNRLLWMSEQDGLTRISPIQMLLSRDDKASGLLAVGSSPTMELEKKSSDEAKAVASQTTRVKLKQYLNTGFSGTELREICFDLGIDCEELQREDKREFIVELITHVERRGRLPELIEACQRLRPNLIW